MTSRKPHKKALTPGQVRKLNALRMWQQIKAKGRQSCASRPGRYYLDMSDKRFWQLFYGV